MFFPVYQHYAECCFLVPTARIPCYARPGSSRNTSNEANFFLCRIRKKERNAARCASCLTSSLGQKNATRLRAARGRGPILHGLLVTFANISWNCLASWVWEPFTASVLATAACGVITLLGVSSWSFGYFRSDHATSPNLVGSCLNVLRPRLRP
jgi:hypothetical protein